MRFSRLRWSRPLCLGGVLILLVGIICSSCTEEVHEDDVFDDVRDQVVENVLPNIQEESQAVLRNLLNFLAALPQLCATPIAALGRYESALPGLGRPDTVELDDDGDDEGEWTLTWLDRVLGDNDPPLTVNTDTPRVDITLKFFYLSQGGAVLRAIPFSLAPQTALLLAGEPPSYAAGTTEGYFLSQDAASGQWRLRWRALNTPKVFEGSIMANSGVFGVIRRVAEDDDEKNIVNAVASLDVNASSNVISFEETTTVTEEKGFTFFVRPGERVQFQLRLGPVNGSTQDITREQLRIGAADQPLPVTLDIDNFSLGSLLPSSPLGTPNMTELGTYMWQDVVTSGCNPAEDQWRIRFHRQTDAPRFSGTVSSIDDDSDVRILSVVRVGSCPAVSLDNQQDFSYDCTLSTNILSGYDLCVTAGGRLRVSPHVNGVEDPRQVFIGGNAEPPPSPLPFSLFFDIDISEQQSASPEFKDLRLTDSTVSLRGNTEEDDDDQVILNPDQVSFDPLCRIPSESVQPRVRLINNGEYSTSRFEGSEYRLEQVTFTDRGVNSLDDFRRFPDECPPGSTASRCSEVRLITRVEDEPQRNSTIEALMQDIRRVKGQPRNGQVTMPVEIKLVIHEVHFDFPAPTAKECSNTDYEEEKDNCLALTVE